ncbi:MAG: putative signaling protein [Ilumatobacteraceae bacterium]|nr:putative signaling protein [Ilumatobacteraceae bacterium]
MRIETISLIGALAVALIVVVLMVGAKRSAATVAQRFDIERGELEAQLTLAHERGQLLVDQSTLGWWEYDTRTGVISSDEQWVPADGHAALALLHPDDRPTALAMRQHAHTGVSRATLRVVRPDVPMRWIEVATMPMAGCPHRLLGVTTDVTARKDAEADLQVRLEVDELTGCVNRAGLTRVITDALADGTPFALLLVDLDHFTDINVTLGHPVGDHVLVSVARRFAWALRRHDVLARLGGDEFAVVVRTGQDEGGVDAATAATELIEMLEIPVDVDGVAITARASVGVALAPDDAGDLDTLLRRADLALHRAKQRGGTWARFEPADEAAVARRRQLSESLPIALSRPATGMPGLDVHFQPIIDLATNRVVSAEALARWRHPALGDVPPPEFVALAERYGLGMGLFRFVLGRSLGHLAQWRAEGLLDSIAVNVSPLQLVDSNVFTVVADALVVADLPPSALTLEITEDALIDVSGDATGTMRRLHELGVRLAIDDFGTGYSSLTHLRLLHIDVLKLDRSFVLGLGTESGQDALVALAVGTAHQLGLTVVAEGVEDADTLAMLGQQGCDAAQGFHICRPAAGPAVHDWLADRAAAGALPHDR